MKNKLKDKYQNFLSLEKGTAPKSYNFYINDAENDFLIFTPHGGGIEPGTSEICRTVAQLDYSIYLFEGNGNNCKRLHITSTNFDEPQLLELLSRHKYAVSIHGMTNEASKQLNADIFIGGNNEILIKSTTVLLRQESFSVSNNMENANSSLSGNRIDNVTNKCRSSKGMQIEISEKLRASFFIGNHYKKLGRKRTTNNFNSFCEIIRCSIVEFKS